MPPKQVYGRRINATGATYTKFLSPDNEDGTQRAGKRRGVDRHEIEVHNGGAVNLEQQMEALELNDSNMESEKKNKRKDLRKPNASQICDPFHGTKSGGAGRTRENRRTKGKFRDTESEKSRGQSIVSRTTVKEGRPFEKTRQCPAELQDPNALDSNPDTTDIIPPIRSTSQNSRRQTKPHAPPLKPQLSNPDPTPGLEDLYSLYVAPLTCLNDGHQIVPFDKWASRLDPYVNVAKIAEASFSEVYRLTVKSAEDGPVNESVVKVVALRTPPNAPLPSERVDRNRRRQKGDVAEQLEKERQEREAEDEWKSQVEDVASEARLLQNLNDIPGFTVFRELTILQGRPSKSFAQAWKDWNKSRPRGKKSEFPDPTRKASYEDTQLWAVIEMQDAGTDCGKVMEAGGISTIWEVWDVFWGVCLSVAKAEEGCKFEHRDLHMDNICIRSSNLDARLTERSVQDPLKRKLGFTGLETTVIDYTLSRAEIMTPSRYGGSRRDSSSSCLSSSTSSSSSSSSASSTTKNLREIAYIDLNKDEALFEGDAEDEYQYEIYRYMRTAVYNSNQVLQHEDSCQSSSKPIIETPRRSPRKSKVGPCITPEPIRSSPRKSTAVARNDKDIWKHFHPKTNLIWTHFILYKLLENLHSNGNEPASLSNTAIMQNIDADQADAPKIWKKALLLHKILQKVATRLEPGVLAEKGSLGSVKELVVLALENRWLRITDVSGNEV